MLFKIRYQFYSMSMPRLVRLTITFPSHLAKRATGTLQTVPVLAVKEVYTTKFMCTTEVLYSTNKTPTLLRLCSFTHRYNNM